MPPVTSPELNQRQKTQQLASRLDPPRREDVGEMLQKHLSLEAAPEAYYYKSSLDATTTIQSELQLTA